MLTLFTWGKFCSLPEGQQIGIWEFFGSDLHLDLCASGCPTPPPSLKAHLLLERSPIQNQSLKLIQKQLSSSVSNTNTPQPSTFQMYALRCFYRAYLWRGTLQTLPVSPKRRVMQRRTASSPTDWVLSSAAIWDHREPSLVFILSQISQLPCPSSVHNGLGAGP